MTEIENNETALRWISFVREAGPSSLSDSAAVIEVATRLLVEWGSNKADMYLLLSHGVQAGVLNEEVLKGFSPPFCEISRGLDVPVAAPGGWGPGGLPAELEKLENAIGECSRKQGQKALEMGRKLLLAKELCAACGYRFEVFLANLRRRHGLNRATCYTSLRFAQWNLPEELGTAVMKWIVQGFERDSADANQVIAVVLTEGLTLEALEARFGLLRRKRLSYPAAPNLVNPQNSALQGKLVRRKLRLESQRAELDLQIKQIEDTLQQFALSAPTEDPIVASYDSRWDTALRRGPGTAIAQSKAVTLVDRERREKMGGRPCSPSS